METYHPGISTLRNHSDRVYNRYYANDQCDLGESFVNAEKKTDLLGIGIKNFNTFIKSSGGERRNINRNSYQSINSEWKTNQTKQSLSIDR